MRVIINFFLLPLLLSSMLTLSAYAKSSTAIFAGGCFWCVEADFDKVGGVRKTISGYIGGDTLNPTYKQVSQGGTGYYEAVKIVYNPDQITYQQLLDKFWHSIDPTDPTGQFCDKGTQYLSAIFYLNKNQKKIAIASKKQLIESGKLPRVVTQILPAGRFYPAEEHHQNYYQKNPIRYKYYRYNCGRDKRVKEVWG